MPNTKESLEHALAEAYAVHTMAEAENNDKEHFSLLRHAELELEKILAKNYGLHEDFFINLFGEKAAETFVKTGKVVLWRGRRAVLDVPEFCAAVA